MDAGLRIRVAVPVGSGTPADVEAVFDRKFAISRHRHQAINGRRDSNWTHTVREGVRSMTRRDLLKLALTTCGTAASVPSLVFASQFVPAANPSHTLTSLRELASSRGILFGSMVLRKTLATDAKYANLVTEQSGIVVPGNELKWDALRPTPSKFDFTEGDWIEQFARLHGMPFRGHTDRKSVV